MSVITQFGGGGVKSIQRGVITISGGTSATATISAVVTAKTELRFLGGSGNDSVSQYAIIPRIALTNTTTITATAELTTTATVSWELTEFY